MIKAFVELLKNNLKNFLLVSTRGSPSWMNSIRPLEEIQRRLENQTTHFSERRLPNLYFSLQTHKITFLPPFYSTYLDILSPFFRRSFLRRFFTFGLFINFVVFFLSLVTSLLAHRILAWRRRWIWIRSGKVESWNGVGVWKEMFNFSKNLFSFFLISFPPYM